MYTITVSRTERVPHTGGDFIAVTALIQKDDETVDQRRLGFPLDTTQEAIREDLAKILDTYLSDLQLATENQRSEELNTHAEELKASLQGMTITHESSSESESTAPTAPKR